jgi:uncharacterized protein (DUF2141 family)
MMGRISKAVALSILASAPAAARAATVEVVVANIPANGNPVLASLCYGGLDQEYCKRGTRVPASKPALVFRFEGVEPGRYAFVAFQDLDGSGTLTRTPMGLPLEPFAISNNAGLKRRPTFEQAAFEVPPAGTTILVQMHTLAIPRSEPR